MKRGNCRVRTTSQEYGAQNDLTITVERGGKPLLSVVAWQIWETRCCCSWLIYTFIIGRADPSGWLLKCNPSTRYKCSHVTKRGRPVPGGLAASKQATRLHPLQYAQRSSLALQRELSQTCATSRSFSQGSEWFEWSAAALGHYPVGLWFFCWF